MDSVSQLCQTCQCAEIPTFHRSILVPMKLSLRKVSLLQDRIYDQNEEDRKENSVVVITAMEIQVP